MLKSALQLLLTNIPNWIDVVPVKVDNNKSSSINEIYYLRDFNAKLACKYGSITAIASDMYGNIIGFNSRPIISNPLSVVKECSNIISNSLGHIAIVNQVHGCNIAILNQSNSHLFDIETKDYSFIEADAIITNLKNRPIGVYTADCVPILIRSFDPDYIAVVHSGWRGSAADINEKIIYTLLQLGCKVSNMSIFIGPSIFVNNYQVGTELEDIFLQKSKNNSRFFKTIKGQRFFDNRKFCIETYYRLGIETIIDSYCNTFNSSIFSSYRSFLNSNTSTGRSSPANISFISLE